MPVPGPRTQFGPDDGYRNPENAAPTLFNQWNRPGPIWWPGRSPGTMVLTLRGCKLGYGQIRRLWRQSIDYFTPQNFSWTENSNQPSMPGSEPNTSQITRALRYMTRSIYIGGGVDHSRYDELHTVIRKQNAYKTVTVNVGQKRTAPTIRNRVTSFGSRVPTLNRAIMAAEKQQPGGATQA
jgi:hypothetical protein